MKICSFEIKILTISAYQNAPKSQILRLGELFELLNKPLEIVTEWRRPSFQSIFSLENKILGKLWKYFTVWGLSLLPSLRQDQQIFGLSNSQYFFNQGYDQLSNFTFSNLFIIFGVFFNLFENFSMVRNQIRIIPTSIAKIFWYKFHKTIGNEILKFRWHCPLSFFCFSFNAF